MNTQDAYNNWSSTYDTNLNKTRDLEAKVIRLLLADKHFSQGLEIGCGTGKNTGWLAEKCDNLLAVDFSAEMLAAAREKFAKRQNIQFMEADITRPWPFPPVDLITCSLVLEHIEDLGPVFKKASAVLRPGGYFYICELHPYRQLQGSRAKFEKDGQLHELEYFVHHISDFLHRSRQAGLTLKDVGEWFDDDDRTQPPRLVSVLFCK